MDSPPLCWSLLDARRRRGPLGRRRARRFRRSARGPHRADDPAPRRPAARVVGRDAGVRRRQRPRAAGARHRRRPRHHPRAPTGRVRPTVGHVGRRPREGRRARPVVGRRRDHRSRRRHRGHAAAARRRARGRCWSSARTRRCTIPSCSSSDSSRPEGAHRALLDESTAPRRHAERTRHTLAVLAACTDRDTGAVIASPTTSLPEVVGGDRQFDYRYSWLRDSSVAITVASLLGRRDAAARYMEFLEALGPEGILESPVRTVDGEPTPEEREVAGVEGWLDSRPVRVGNAAGNQTPVRRHRVRRRRDLRARAQDRASSLARPGRSCARWPIGPPKTTVSRRTGSGSCASRRRWSRPTSGAGSRSTARCGSRAVIDRWSAIAGRWKKARAAGARPGARCAAARRHAPADLRRRSHRRVGAAARDVRAAPGTRPAGGAPRRRHRARPRLGPAPLPLPARRGRRVQPRRSTVRPRVVVGGDRARGARPARGATTAPTSSARSSPPSNPRSSTRPGERRAATSRSCGRTPSAPARCSSSTASAASGPA